MSTCDPLLTFRVICSSVTQSSEITYCVLPKKDPFEGIFIASLFNLYYIGTNFLRLLQERILQNQDGHLMLFTQQKSYHFYTTEILFQMVKEI